MTDHKFFSPSICSFEEACEKRKEKRHEQRRIVLTNGCFDLLHVGHIFSLEKASELGEELWVAVNSDSSVRLLKGGNRPIFSQEQRAYMLQSLKCVSLVFIFENENLAKEITALKPDVYVKSGDYSLKTLNPDEREALESVGSKINFVSHLDGFSTTNIINNLSNSRDL